MNPETLAKITAIAEKLGTTTEHLWSVLIRQAAISAAVDITVISLWAIALILSAIYVQKKTSRTTDAATGERNYEEWEDVNGYFAWGIIAIFAFAFLLMVGSNANNIVAALLNTEYWALKQIIK